MKGNELNQVDNQELNNLKIKVNELIKQEIKGTY